MTDHNDETKKLSRRDALILGGGSLAGLLLGRCAQAPPVEAPAVPTTAPAVEPPAPEAEAPAPVAEPVVQEIAHLNTTPVNYVGRSLEVCEGCRLCEIACSQFHENGKFWPAASRVRIHEYHPGLEFPVLCYQCGNAPCVEACPEGAISIDPETSTMIYDPELCLRVVEGADCTECFDACPGNAITFHPESQLPISCDLCGGE